MAVLSKEDHYVMVEEYNLTNKPDILGRCLHKLLENSANQYANNIAVLCAEQELRYHELNDKANRYARFLVEQGVQPRGVVGVALDPSPDLVVAMVAVLKAGAAYMPIDPTFPTKRIQYMLDDAGASFVVVSSSTRDSIASCTGTKYALISTDKMEASSNSEGGNLADDVQPHDLAYVIYTSGSTGRPKGVEISHEALSNLLLSAQDTLKCNETDRFLAITTVSFDIAALELFLPLLCGAVMVIAQRQDTKDASALHSLIRQNAITMMQATPTTWQMLLEYGFQKNSGHSLSKILCGGEALSPKLADALLRVGDGRCTVWNMYGPTEATVWASAWIVERDKPVLIGSPLSNYKLYVLDHDLTPTPLGAIGELYIGGSSLARSYRNNADLTSFRFIKNPFHHGLMYRTGDLARFLAPGELAVVGRADSQVKVRGYRIELGDIESAIVTCDEISEAVVVHRDQRLVAYYTAEHVAGGATGRLPSLGDKLRAWLAKRLPPYMTPDFFVALKEFPKTLNNKIDRKALPVPLPSAVPAKSAVAESITEMEVHILDIWSRVLGLDRNLINRDSNFFQIGGNSVLAVRVQSALEQLLGRPVKAAKLFEHFTMKKLAAHLASRDSLANTDSSIEERQPEWQQQRITNTIQQDDIAIISMACRLPGAATTPAKYWQLLVNGVDAITEVPKDRWDAEALYSAAPKTPGKSCCRQGGFVDSVDSFDASFFSLSPREARDLEPAQSLMLETCWEGLENAGYTTDKLHGSETGVYIGISNIAAHSGSSYDAQDLGGYAGTGSASSTISGRISYSLGLEGPTLTVDTACSSSLVATHLACSALKQGECDMAVVGGVTLLLSPGIHIEFSQLGGMSPDGRCRAFSAGSEGTGWAEGATVVVLKRLSDARRDHDTIHGVLRGSAVNHGGRSASLTTPSGPAQQRLILSALSASGLTPGEIDYIEAHGTGTKLGDPIEGEALAAVFRDSRANIEEQPPLWIGSAKSNIGHTQAAAGLAGLIKVVLALRNETLPPTLHVTQPTPGVDWQGAHMALVQEKRAWPLLTGEKSRLRRAGVSAFGIGGTNAHVIVEEPPRQLTAATTAQSQTNPNSMNLKPFLLSGHTDAALYEQAKKLQVHLIERRVKLSDDDAQGAHNPDNSQGYAADVAYSLATTRNHFQKRLVLLAQDEADLVQKLTAVPTRGIYTPKDHDQGQGSSIAMLFTGQGSQLPGMGRDLAKQYPVFQETVVQIASHFDSELDHALLDVMWAQPSGAHSRLLEQTNYAQPALFTLQVGLSRLWESWGVQTDYVLGHSIGEIAAAHIAGVMSLSDACRLVASRGRLMHQLPCRGGSMVSLEASASEVTKAMEAMENVADGRVSIAAYNAPLQTVVSGDSDAVELLSRLFASHGRKVKTISATHAFHSHHMDNMLQDFTAVVDSIRFHSPTIRFISTVTGKTAEPSQLTQAAYWVQQVRYPVRFSDGIQDLFSQGANIFIELGPQPILCSLGALCSAEYTSHKDNTVSSTNATWLPSLAPGKGDVVVIQRALSELHVRHLPIDWATYFMPFGGHRVELPTYAFQRTRFWTRRHVFGNTTKMMRQDVPGGSVLPPQNGVNAFRFNINWHTLEVDDTHCPAGSWGLFCPAAEDGSWAKTVEAALSSVGMRIHRISYVQEAEHLDGLICLWHSDEDDIISQTRQLSASALQLVQDAAQAGYTFPIVWVTLQAVGTGSENDDGGYTHTGLAASLLWGLARTARNEHPELRLRLIDVTNSDDSLTALASSLRLEHEDECAIRNGQLLLPRMQGTENLSSTALGVRRGRADDNLVRRDGPVLITGGTGGLGSFIAKWLVESHGVRDLVLTSRRGMEAPGAEALIQDLQQLGAKAQVIASNLSDENSVRGIMKLFSQHRPLRGVIHTAGVLDDGVLISLTPERCYTTFQPKMDGAWYLHQQTKALDLDIFALFSSISGIMGTAGQGNYAAANTFLDRLAYLRQAQNLPATSVAWGLWGGHGMGANLSETGRVRYAQAGLHPLKPEDGVSLLDRAIRGGSPLTVAAAYDLKQLGIHYSKGEAFPSMLESLLDHPDRSGVLPLDQSDDEGDFGLRDKLSKSSPEVHVAITLAMVRKTVAKILGFESPDDVSADKPLQEIGIDSLTAILTRNQLVSLTGLMLSPRIVFEQRNLVSLSQFLSSRIQELLDVSSSEMEDSGVSTPGSAVPDEPFLNLVAIRQGCLDPSITFENTKATDTPASPRSVLVTGGTGFVGAFITHRLLELGLDVYCLVRADSLGQAEKRLVTTLSSYDLWKPSYAPILKPVIGDMGQLMLGLPQDQFDSLANNVDAICHSAALVDWMRPLEDYVRPNIVSTHELLRLASTGRSKTIHLVSTVSTLAKHLGYEMLEDEREYGYATSKWTAEKMLDSARWRGARTSVYRLPFVTAAASTGHFRNDRGDFLHNLFAGCIQMGWFPNIEADLSAVLAVDYLADTIVAIMTQNRTWIGRDFDFLNADAPTFCEFSKLMGAARQGQGILPFGEWRQRALAHAAANPTGSLARIAAVVDMLTEDSAAAMIGASPVGRHVLGGTDYPVPPVDREYVDRYISRIK